MQNIVFEMSLALARLLVVAEFVREHDSAIAAELDSIVDVVKKCTSEVGKN